MNLMDEDKYRQFASSLAGAPGTAEEAKTIQDPLRQAGIGKQNAFHQLALARIKQQAMRNKLNENFQKYMTQLQLQANEAGPLDFLSVIPGIGSVVGGLGQKLKWWGK